MAREPEIEHSIDQCFRKDMRLKLAAANQAMADAGMAWLRWYRPACSSAQDAAAGRGDSTLSMGAVLRAYRGGGMSMIAVGWPEFPGLAGRLR